MKPSDSLFQLIHSLTKSERRYFTIQAGQHVIGERNQYLQLFEAITQQEEYDQEALLKLAFVKNISAEKNYLYNLLLKHMRAYHDEETPVQQIWVALQNVDFLNQKGLFADAKKQLRLAKELAIKYQKIEYLPKILDEEATIVKREAQKNLSAAIAAIADAAEQASALLITEARLAAIYNQVFARARQAKELKSPQFLQELEQLLENELASPPTEDQTLQARLYYHQAMYMIFRARGETRQAHPHFLRVVRLIEEHPHLSKEHETKYRVGLSNLLVSAYALNLWDLFPEVLAKIKSYPQLSFDVEAEVFQNVAYLEVIYHLNQGRFEAAEKLVPEIEAGLARYSSRLNKARELSIIYNIGLLYFVVQRMDLAGKWFRKIEQFSKTEHRQDIQASAQLMLLLILLDREETEVLDYKLRGAKSGGAGRSSLDSFEAVVLDFLEKANGTERGPEFSALCATFCQQMKAQSSQVVSEFRCTEEMRYWAKAKLSGRTIREVALEEMV